LNRETILRWILVAAVTLAVVVGFWKIEPYLPLPRPAPKSPATAVPPPPAKPVAEKPAAGKPAGEKPAGEKATAPPAAKVAALNAVGAAEAAPPIVLGSALRQSNFDLEAEVTPVGAAVSRLALSRRDFFKTVEDRHKPADERAAMELVAPSAPAAFTIPRLSVTLKGAEGPSDVNLSKAVWKIVESTPTQAVLAIDIQDADGKAVLSVRRTYTLHPRAEALEAGAAAPPQYELKMNLEFIPAGDRVEKVMYELSGSPELPVEPGRGVVAAAVAATWASGGVKMSPLSPLSPSEIAKGAELPKTASLAGTDLVWAGQMDKYFAVVMIPQKPAREGTFAAGAETEWYCVQHERADTAVPGVRIISREIPLAAGKPVEHQVLVFAGPKDADLLERYYGDLGLDKLIIWASPCCGNYVIPGVDTLSRLLAGLMDALNFAVRNYGIAIILLVFLLRLVLHPVTRWSTRSMLEMQKMAPKMEQIRKEFGHDKERMQQEMAKIGGFKSFSGCLPMFIQMPIWIALYGALGAAIHLRHAAFIPIEWLPAGSLFLQDLSSPDAMIAWQTPFFVPGREVPLLGFIVSTLQQFLSGSPNMGLTTFNLLPILVGVSFYLQQKMTPQPAAASPQMEQQRKMMNFMMIFFALMMYSLPSGLCLYISASSFLGFFEQRYLKKHMAARAALAASAVPETKEPSKPQLAASPKRLASGRDKSIAERIQAWVNQRMNEKK
jgi:YidC/Oxa1 family membrane protein insertase